VRRASSGRWPPRANGCTSSNSSNCSAKTARGGTLEQLEDLRPRTARRRPRSLCEVR
jgi:hypothetical protein